VAILLTTLLLHRADYRNRHCQRKEIRIFADDDQGDISGWCSGVSAVMTLSLAKAVEHIAGAESQKSTSSSSFSFLTIPSLAAIDITMVSLKFSALTLLALRAVGVLAAADAVSTFSISQPALHVELEC
jgi:hypothetical protein